MAHSSTRRFLFALSLVFVAGIGLVLADGGALHQAAQTGAIKLGTSGGNVNDITKRFCCSGTLGSLVSIGSTQYILSNNHVMARADQAGIGEDISQPGLIDNGCRAGRRVADFSQTSTLGTENVDAALAQVVSGAVSSTGEILDVGVPSSTTAAPAITTVAKSGRTTGLTCGNVTSFATDVNVQYQKNCGQGKKFVISYTNQIVVGGGGFSAGGDSGSLIVTAGQARPFALLYAGSSTTTIGNPVGDVINAFPGLAFVGGNDHAVSCPGSASGGISSTSPGRSAQGLERARTAKEQHGRALMMDDAVMGVGVGLGDDGEPAVVIYVEEGREHLQLPQSLNGVQTKIIRTDTIRAYGWNEPAQRPGTCSAN